MTQEKRAHDRMATDFCESVHHLAVESHRGRGESGGCRHIGRSNSGTGERHDDSGEQIANARSG